MAPQASAVALLCLLGAPLAALPAVAGSAADSVCEAEAEAGCKPSDQPALLQVLASSPAALVGRSPTAFAWAILGVDSYTVAGHRGDWWSLNDVYIRFVVRPSGWAFQSTVAWNVESSSRPFYAYVPSGTEVAVELWDRDEGFNDDLIGRTVVAVADLPTGRRTVRHKIGKSSVTVTLATGRESVLETAAALSRKGVFVEYHEDGGASKYALERVPAEGVEGHLAYAAADSVFPRELQGILWMDQRGAHLRDYPSGPPGDPSYRQKCAQAEDEVLLAFGEAGWDPAGHGCVVSQHIYAGGPLRGHWTWLDQTGAGDSSGWDGSAFNVPNAHFCFQDAERTRINIPRYWEAFWGFRFPDWVMELGMVKKPWGWDRVTHLGPGGLLGTCHYPVWQIVDGHGWRTEHYEAYLRFSNAQSPPGQETSTFASPLNKGKGTLLVGRLQPPR